MAKPWQMVDSVEIDEGLLDLWQRILKTTGSFRFRRRVEPPKRSISSQ